MPASIWRAKPAGVSPGAPRSSHALPASSPLGRKRDQAVANVRGLKGYRAAVDQETTGASRPLAAWTVMMRTSSRVWSISRLISRAADCSVARKGLEAGQAGLLLRQREIQELVENVAGLLAEPGDHFARTPSRPSTPEKELE